MERDGTIRPVRTRPRTERRTRSPKDEEGWDRRLDRIWGAVLVITFVLPISYNSGYRGSGSFLFVWDMLDHADTLVVVSALLPLFLGIAALVLASHRSPRLRGLVLLLGGLLVAVVPILATGPMLFGPLGRAATLVAIWFVVLLAPPAVSGANRVARRTGADPLLRALAGLGGLAMLLILFLPIGPNDESLVGALFGSGVSAEVLGRIWPLLLWLMVVLVYAGTACLYLVPSVSAEGIGAWVSLAARFALVGLPASVLLLALMTGGLTGSSSGPALLLLLAGFGRLYGLMILTAIGVALVLERPTPTRTPADVERVFR